MPLAIDNILLPAVQVQSMGGVATDSAISASDGGIEQRNAWWPTQKEKFTLKIGPPNVPLLRRLFRTQDGPVYNFLIDHFPDDDVVVNVVLEKITSGGVTKCQLRQAYTQGARTVYRPIHRIAGSPGILTVTIDTVPTLAFTGGNATDGVLTFESVVGGTIRVSIPKFYKVVRFAEDRLTISRRAGVIRDIQSCIVVSEIFAPQIVAV